MTSLVLTASMKCRIFFWLFFYKFNVNKETTLIKSCKHLLSKILNLNIFGLVLYLHHRMLLKNIKHEHLHNSDCSVIFFPLSMFLLTKKCFLLKLSKSHFSHSGALTKQGWHNRLLTIYHYNNSPQWNNNLLWKRLFNNNSPNWD
jgi:hypothetical protein